MGLEIRADWDSNLSEEEALQSPQQYDVWEEHDLPDGSTVMLPHEWRPDFRDHVDTVASASECWSPFGPMSREQREYICRLEDVWLVRSEGDSGGSIDFVHRFESAPEAVAACVAASSAFVLSPAGPVSVWSDEDIDGDIVEDRSWDPDEFDGPDDHDDEDEAGRDAWWELQSTTIEINGVVVAGENASPVLPANTTLFVIPGTPEMVDALGSQMSVQTGRATVGDRSRIVAVFDGVAPTTAAQIADAFGVDVFWQLDEDTIKAIEPIEPAIIAWSLRER
jgi:hypothetical protein